MRYIIIPLFLFLTFVANAQVKTVYIQPLGNVKTEYIDTIKTTIEWFFGCQCIIKPNESFTKDLLANSKTRYSADRILNKFNNLNNTLVITEKDIVTVDIKSPEWGIFGLGKRPGTICVVSTLRLKRNVKKFVFIDRLKKVCLHEIGHNLGLEHCSNNIHCLMNAANGSAKEMNNECFWFCDNCRKKLNK